MEDALKTMAFVIAALLVGVVSGCKSGVTVKPNVVDGGGSQIQQGSGLRLATSRGQAMPTESIVVTVRADGILVADKLVVAVECFDPKGEPCGDEGLKGPGARLGVVSTSKRDRSARSYVIEPLLQTLTALGQERKQLERTTGRPFNPLATLVFDHRIPYRLVGEVIHTSGLAELNTIRFAVLDPHRSRQELRAVPLYTPRARDIHQAKHDLTLSVTPDGFKFAAKFLKPAKTFLNVFGPKPKQPPAPPAPLFQPIAKASDGRLQFHQLYNRLREIRKRYPRANVVWVNAYQTLSWQNLASTLEAATTLLEADSYNTAKAYRGAKRTEALGARQSAFSGAGLSVSD